MEIIYFHPPNIPIHRGTLHFAAVNGPRIALTQAVHWENIGKTLVKIGKTRSRSEATNCKCPRCSMYDIFTNIYPINDSNVGKYFSTMEHLGVKKMQTHHQEHLSG